jgi:hypothetical protein
MLNNPVAHVEKQILADIEHNKGKYSKNFLPNKTPFKNKEKIFVFF